MDKDQIKQVLLDKLNLDQVMVTVDGNYFKIIAISPIFHGMNLVKRQQLIYAPLMEYITNNKLHALSINTYTQEEWTITHNINS